MNSLLVVVKSHLFLSNEIAITSSGERDEVAADNRGGRAWHSGEKWGSGSQSRWAGMAFGRKVGQWESISVGGQSIGSKGAAVTHNPDS